MGTNRSLTRRLRKTAKEFQGSKELNFIESHRFFLMPIKSGSFVRSKSPGFSIRQRMEQ